MKKVTLSIVVLLLSVSITFAQTTVTVDANDLLTSNTKIVAYTSVGQSFFTAHQAGATYSMPDGIFRAITDNSNGAANYYFDGLTNGSRNFSVRADGQGYFDCNVGIGTATAGAKVTVSANSSLKLLGYNSVVNFYGSAGGDRARISIGNTSTQSTSSAILFYGNNSANSALESKWEIGTDLSGNHGRDMYFYNTNINGVQMFLQGDCDVGICTTDTHGYKFAVNGIFVQKR